MNLELTLDLRCLPGTLGKDTQGFHCGLQLLPLGHLLLPSAKQNTKSPQFWGNGVYLDPNSVRMRPRNPGPVHCLKPLPLPPGVGETPDGSRQSRLGTVRLHCNFSAVEASVPRFLESLPQLALQQFVSPLQFMDFGKEAAESQVECFQHMDVGAQVISQGAGRYSGDVAGRTGRYAESKWAAGDGVAIAVPAGCLPRDSNVDPCTMGAADAVRVHIAGRQKKTVHLLSLSSPAFATALFSFHVVRRLVGSSVQQKHGVLLLHVCVAALPS
ncbi:hypothetical protein INR49_029782 [Caranx melampygus]|nr:hypothetical protein INR49_029782 [Caranx melampygus]